MILRTATGGSANSTGNVAKLNFLDPVDLDIRLNKSPG